MQDRDGLALRLADDRLQLLDQARLPQMQDWLSIDDAQELIAAIHGLKVRGAPMIAVASALLVGIRATMGDDRGAIKDVIERLRGARPTAVNLVHAMEALRAALVGDDWRARVITAAEALYDGDRALCDVMAGYGAALVEPGERILTHCNTGALATAGVGTALGVIRRAHEQGKGISVWVDETRPLLQGARLTAWELGELGIPYTLITDSMAAALMAAGQIDRVVVGADRIAANGDFANKIGTYGLAVLARHHGIPFVVVAPHTTLDPNSASGVDIPIEQRAPAEVRGASGAAGDLCWAPVNAMAANPAFDVTPGPLVTHWVLDTGVFGPHDVIRGGALRRGGAAFAATG